MSLKRFGAAAIGVGAVVAIWTTIAAAAGPPSNSFLCYSKFQIDPGVWSDSPTDIKGGLGGNVSASALLKLGYWKPYAEKSTPTNTKLPGGWYLHCNPASATTAGTPAPATAIIGGDGETITEKTLTDLPGYYPSAP